MGWQLDAADAPDVVVVCGGDGTVHREVNEWAERAEPRPVLAVAPPFGTANMLAHALGVPADAERAAAWLHAAQPRPMPLGVATTSVGRRYFFAVASAGFDAAIVHALSAGRGAERKRRWGKLAFAGEAAARWRQPAPEGVLFSLTPFYAGNYRLGAPGEDGVWAFQLEGGGWARAGQALGLALGQFESAPGVRRLPPGAVEIREAGIAVELDGEAAGHTPARFERAGIELRVLVR